jgi:hypothetical protein
MPAFDNIPATYCTYGFEYNYITRGWTRRIKAVAAGHILSYDNKLYMGHAVDAYMLQERKTYDGAASYPKVWQNYADETIPITVTSCYTADGVTYVEYTWSDYGYVPVGSVFTQGTSSAYIDMHTSIAGPVYTSKLDRYDASWVVGAATITLGIPSRVKWAPEHAGAYGTLKQFQETQVYLEDEPHNLAPILSTALSPWSYMLEYTTDMNSTEKPLSTKDVTTLETPAILRAIVPRDYQICRALGFIFEHSHANQFFNILSILHKLRVIGTVTARDTA